MLKFSIRKYLVVVFLFAMVAISANEESFVASFFENIENKLNDSNSLEKISKIQDDVKVNTLVEKISQLYASLTVEFTETNFKIKSADAYSATFLNQIVSDFRSELVNNSFDLDANFTILVSNDLCNIIGVKYGAVLPSSLLNNNTTMPVIVLSENYTSSTIKELVDSFIKLSSKNQKKYATEPILPVEDLRLHINIVYIANLVQVEELALSPTSLSTGTSAQLRAKGGTGDYTWRLIPAETSDSKISSTVGTDTTYTTGSNETRTFDVLVLSDGIEEVSINIVVVKARLKNDGSGSKGSGGCFIRQHYKD